MAADDPDLEPPKVNIFTPEFAACPQAAYREVLDQCPVARASFNDAPVIFAYEEVVWALRHPEIFSSDMWEQMRLGNERPMIPQQLDPPLQTKYRKLLDPQFSRKRMLAIDPPLRLHANELIDAFIDDGECEFDSAFAIPLPCTAFLALFGLPQEDLELFLRLKDGIIRPESPTNDPDEAAELRAAAGREIYDYFSRVIVDREKKPREDDMVSYLLGSQINGEKLSHNDILDICYLQLIAGLDTVTSTLGCNIAYLASNPAQRQRLVDDPSAIPNAIEELLRWETPVTTVPRVVTQDVELGGVKIKAGEFVLLMLGAADIDRGAFPNADEVDFDRERNRHVAFGAGAHRCLGSHLARIELTAAMEEWHRRIPDYSIKPGETPRYSPGIREVQYLPLVWKAG
jgi:cytochrome P450